MKIGRNDPCFCKSGLKYKKCCLGIDNPIFTEGQSESSDRIDNCMDLLRAVFPECKVIDITKYLTASTYRNFQIRNYNDKVLMIAEKTETTAPVFEGRVRSDRSDIIVMYKGAYRTFVYEDTANVMNDIKDMVHQGDLQPRG